jgi:N-acetylglucosaminyldiphosphoundecaprenol N-acetyl-beta-D-mannosaminyltransferase
MTFSEALPLLKFTDADTPETAVRRITTNWQQNDKAHIVHIAYYASYVMMQKDAELLQSMLLADNILVDGIGMQTYFKWLTGHKPLNLNGTDLAPLWIDHLQQQHIPICFYGTTPDNIMQAVQNLAEQYDRNIIAFYQDGFSPMQWENIPQKAALFVGMGTPLQENWVRENIGIIRDKQLLVVTVGGFFDFLSGFYVRAPQWVRQLKMEWAWRTVLHPGRHFPKRVRDTTIIYKPMLDKRKGFDQLVRFIYLK